jgi:hypothetical protein
LALVVLGPWATEAQPQFVEPATQAIRSLPLELEELPVLVLSNNPFAQSLPRMKTYLVTAMLVRRAAFSLMRHRAKAAEAVEHQP